MKYISMFCLLIVLGLPFSVEAHTHLEGSQPEAGSELTSENPEVTLTFDSNVQEPTALTVTGENGEEFSVEEYTHSPENVIAFSIPEAVESGRIEVFYSIIGEDGHMMENEWTYDYQVMGKAEDTPEETETNSDQNENNDEPEKEKTADTKNSTSSVWIVPVLGFGILVTAGLVFMGIRKKS